MTVATAHPSLRVLLINWVGLNPEKLLAAGLPGRHQNLHVGTYKRQEAHNNRLPAGKGDGVVSASETPRRCARAVRERVGAGGGSFKTTRPSHGSSASSVLGGHKARG